MESSKFQSLTPNVLKKNVVTLETSSSFFEEGEEHPCAGI